MNSRDLLQILREKGAYLSRDGDRLVVNAPTGAIGPALLGEIRRKKSELLDILAQVRKEEGVPARIPRLPREGGLPLGLSQERFWYLGSLASESAIYNLPAAFRLFGALSEAALDKALSEIVRRHDSLRTAIRMVDDAPAQIVVEDPVLHVELEDLSGDGVEQALVELHRRIDQLKDVPIDPEVAPMVQARLYRLGPDDHVLFWMPHHLIWDGWSFDIFLRELDVLYGDFVAGRPPSLPEPETQYPDFAVWHREWATGPAMEPHLRFWRDQLRGELPVSGLPTDRPRPDIMAYSGARAVLDLGQDLISALSNLGRAHGATLYMVLLAGFYALLYRYSGQEDLIVGSPVQARLHGNTHETLGVFVNTVVLRASVQGALSFRELLRQVRRVSVDVYDHQDTPFELLVEEANVVRSLSHTPLYQVLFSYQDVRNRGDTVGDLAVSQLHLETSFAPTDLTVWLMETGRGLVGGIDYATELFDSATVEQMIRHYTSLLWSAVENPDLDIEGLPMLSPDEEESLVQLSLGPSADVPEASVSDAVREWASKHPDREAVLDQSGVCTYEGLNGLADLVASKLRASGVGEGDLIGVHMGRTAKLVGTLLGIWRSGAAYLPLDPEVPPARLAQILEGAKARAVITEGHLRERLPGGTDHVVLADWGLGASSDRSGNGNGQAVSVAPQALAYVMYTSGSTGHPKGVEVSHRSVNNLLESVRHAVGFQPDDDLLAVSTYSFDISVLELFLPLLCGGKIILGSNEQVKHAPALLRLLSQTNPTFMQATPSMWRLLRDAGWRGSPQLRIISGGEELTQELASWLTARCGAVFNGYGPTETTIYSSFHDVKARSEKRVPIGRPLANTSLFVLARKQQLVPTGVPGELYIGGVGVARGYRGRPDLTQERFLPNPLGRGGERLYRTGDRACWRRDGSLDFLGRVDNQVQVRGYRVELGEVEAVLEGIPEVAQAAVVAREMGEGDLRLVAYVVFESGLSLTGTDIRRALRTLLPEYMVPGIIEPLGRMPLTSSGKIDRRALPDPLRRAPTKRENFLPPETPQEVMLADVWQQFLSVPRIGKVDNFFDLGGHSLLTMRVVAAVERLTGFRMDSRVMFFQNLEQIAATLPPPMAAGPEGSV